MPSNKSIAVPIAIEVPTARSKDLLIKRVGDELVIYDLQDKQAHCLKALAASVFDRSDGKTPLAEIAAGVESELGTAVTESDVRGAIAELESNGLLELPLPIRGGISRRDAVKRFAFASAAGAVAGPLITSIAAPSSAMALSGIPTGCTGCTTNPDCASGHCCKGVGSVHCETGCCVGLNNSCHSVCVGGTNSGHHCTGDADCPGGTCGCSVTIADANCPNGGCPCAACPPGSGSCCSTATALSTPSASGAFSSSSAAGSSSAPVPPSAAVAPGAPGSSRAPVAPARPLHRARAVHPTNGLNQGTH